MFDKMACESGAGQSRQGIAGKRQECLGRTLWFISTNCRCIVSFSCRGSLSTVCTIWVCLQKRRAMHGVLVFSNDFAANSALNHHWSCGSTQVMNMHCKRNVEANVLQGSLFRSDPQNSEWIAHVAAST